MAVDLGISGKSAIVCGSSRGLGKACALALAKEGVHVWLCARNPDSLREAANEIGTAERGEVSTIKADVTTDAGRDALFGACPKPDIVVNNAAGPPPGDFRDWRQKEWFDAVNANMFSAIDMIRRCLDGMTERRFGRIVNITSIAVKLPQKGLDLSNGARAGLTGFVAGIARQPSEHNVTINNLLPGFTDTERMRTVLKAQANAADIAESEYCSSFFNNIPARRPGRPDEFGAVCAFLCSQQAAYITAQNILVDGGLYPGSM